MGNINIRIIKGGNANAFPTLPYFYQILIFTKEPIVVSTYVVQKKEPIRLLELRIVGSMKKI